VTTSDVLFEVLLAGESFARAVSKTVIEGTKQTGLGCLVPSMDFALVSHESARVGKTLSVLTIWVITLVRSFVAVHVLVPLTESSENDIFATAVRMITKDLVIVVARWRRVTSYGRGSPRLKLILVGDRGGRIVHRRRSDRKTVEQL
jgi:hypothetical protein